MRTNILTVSAAALLAVSTGGAKAQGFEEAQLSLSYGSFEDEFGDYSQTLVAAAVAYSITSTFGVQLLFGGARFSDDFYDQDVHAASLVLTYALTPAVLIGASHSYYWYDNGFNDETERESVYGLHALYRQDPLRLEGALLFPEDDNAGSILALDGRYDVTPALELNTQVIKYFDSDDTFDDSYTYWNVGVDYSFGQQFGVFANVGRVFYEDDDDSDNLEHSIGARYDVTPNLRTWVALSEYRYSFGDDDYEDRGVSFGIDYAIGGTVDNPRTFVINGIDTFTSGVGF